MNMINYDALVLPDATPEDIIADLCDDTGFNPDEPFAFSAVLRPDKENDGCYTLRVNALEERQENPHTIRSLVYTILEQDEPASGIRYAQPPLEQWLTMFRPMLVSLVNRVYSQYERLIPDKEEQLSILYECVVRLYRRGYYLHAHLIRTSFVNALNKECRKLKGLQFTDSLDAPIECDDEGKEISLLDQLADADASEWAYSCTHYTDEDFWDERFETLKAAMLNDMSELAFNRILLQLRTGTVDRNTSYILNKYRQIFNPGYYPRPMARGRNRGGKKK